eukprot:m.78681 g.78681  ORF g.78681 m.78681 type:complete len:358 (-) comp12682_c0_seq6:69-1142(-)
MLCLVLLDPNSVNCGVSLIPVWIVSCIIVTEGSTQERATVTSLIQVAPYIGVSLAYLGPLVIPRGKAGRKGLYILLVAQAASAVAILISVIAYFPSSPAKTPTKSAAIRKEVDMENKNTEHPMYVVLNGLRKALFGWNTRQGRALAVISFTFALPFGIYSGWAAVLSINLKETAHIDSVEAGIIGCFMTMLGSVSAIGVGALNDRFKGRIKSFVLVFMALSSVGFALFGLRMVGAYKIKEKAFDEAVIFGSAMVGGFFMNAALPLYYELAVEETFLVIPAATAAFAPSLWVTAVQIVFLAVSFIPGVNDASSTWMNYAVMLSVPLTTLPLVFLRVDYKRLARDNPDMKISKLDAFGF